jgi:hypothetical protein
MHQFVQSAIEAAKQGDNKKALEFLKQVLNANPNDVDAWLVLAAVVDEPQRKRQCLNRVLKLDPVNQVAREELLEMDRAEMGGTPAFKFDSPNKPASDLREPAPVSIPPFQPETSSDLYASGASAFEPEPAPPPPPAKTKPQTASPAKPPAKKEKEKMLVFKYPIVWRILMYFFVVFFGCIGLVMVTQSVFSTGLVFLLFAGLMLLTVQGISPSVEVSDKGIRASGMFSSAETGWDEITKMKSNAMKRRLELTKRNGEVVKVSTQVSGYPRIVEILQKRRPDLFGMSQRPQTQTSAFSSSYDDGSMTSYGSSGRISAAPPFKVTKTFKKGFFKQYGSSMIAIVVGLAAATAALSDPQYSLGGWIGVAVCMIMFALPFFQINKVKIESNKLTVESMLEQKVFSAKEIREIKMQTVRGRYGRATNYVNVVPVKGKNYPLQGFSEGEEIIFGILTNWWDANRSA